MSTDYSYDDQGQFFPYFFVTVSALVIVPVTYSALKPRKELENTAPKIQSDFKPQHADLVDGQRRKQRKRERKVKRIILAAVGWAFIALNVYWMVTVQRTAPKIWDPYEILGVDRVSPAPVRFRYLLTSNRVSQRGKFSRDTANCRSHCTPTKPSQMRPRTKPWRR